MNVQDLKNLEKMYYNLAIVTEAEEPTTEVPEEEPAADPTMTDPGMDPSMAGMDPSMAGMGGMGGMGGGMGFGEEPPKPPTDLGRTYELKKIYYRLATLSKILSNSPDKKLDKLSKLVGDAFNIFQLVANNPKSYISKVDDIIIHYYKFLSACVSKLEPYYKKQYERHQSE
mgnify:CR=1 FL=1